MFFFIIPKILEIVKKKFVGPNPEKKNANKNKNLDCSPRHLIK